MAVIKHTKKKKEYKENNDTLITFGENAYTMRKDDPRTEEAKKEAEEKRVQFMKNAIANGEAGVFEGINLSDKRGDEESREEFLNRRATNKNLEKIYNTLGRDECIRQFPMGFKYAIELAVVEEHEKAKLKVDEGEQITPIEDIEIYESKEEYEKALNTITDGDGNKIDVTEQNKKIDKLKKL